MRVLGGVRRCGGKNSLEHHLYPSSLWNGEVKTFDIQRDECDLGVFR